MRAGILLITLFIFVSTASAQPPTGVEEIQPYTKTIRNGRAYIYGQFIQRLGFSSGGFSQYIKLYNLDDKHFYYINVKPSLRSKKLNRFHNSVPAGKYIVYSYEWTKSKWYGGLRTTEGVYKNATAKELDERQKSGITIMESELERFILNIESGKVNYLGTWNFTDDKPVFTNEKQVADEDMQDTYYFKFFDLGQAAVNIPQ